MNTRDISKKVNQLSDTIGFANRHKEELKEMLSPLVDFEIYIQIFESDGITVMSETHARGMRVMDFVKWIESCEEWGDVPTEEIFLKDATL